MRKQTLGGRKFNWQCFLGSPFWTQQELKDPGEAVRKLELTESFKRRHETQPVSRESVWRHSQEESRVAKSHAPKPLQGYRGVFAWVTLCTRN